MRIFGKAKDGGPDSTVIGYWLAEIKKLFSVAVLKFGDGGRDAYHSHAFDSVSWVLSGHLIEQHLDGRIEIHKPGLRPVITRRSTFHRVISAGTTWVFTLRGPWEERWYEFMPDASKYVELSDGRKVERHWS